MKRRRCPRVEPPPVVRNPERFRESSRRLIAAERRVLRDRQLGFPELGGLQAGVDEKGGK
jgi:hypothetical protein